MKSLEEYLEIALKATDEIGAHALKKFGPIKESFHKQGTEYGIEEDKECNALYIDFLKRETPEVGLYTEEGEQSLTEELVWTVDPIDGTSNYSLGNPFWNTQICLLKNKEPVVAVVFGPALNQKFWAVLGGGTFLNGKKIEISNLEKPEEKIVFGLGAGNTREEREWLGSVMEVFMKRFKSPRVLSATGLEMVYTAAGMIDIFFSKGASIWDYAPGVLIVRESGGVVLNFEGKDWTIDDETLVASNETLAKKVLELL